MALLCHFVTLAAVAAAVASAVARQQPAGIEARVWRGSFEDSHRAPAFPELELPALLAKRNSAVIASFARRPGRPERTPRHRFIHARAFGGNVCDPGPDYVVRHML